MAIFIELQICKYNIFCVSSFASLRMTRFYEAVYAYAFSH